MNINKFKKSIVILGFIVSGCANSINCDVVSYNELGAPKGETFQLVHKNMSETRTPEYSFYARQILEKMKEVGYNIVPDDSPDYVFTIDYGVMEGTSEVENPEACPLHYHYNEDGDPDPEFYGADCDEHEVWEETYYNHFLEVSIRRWTPTELEELPLFEGQVFSKSTVKQMPKLMPYLIEALFIDFPGEKFVVKSVVLDKKKP